MRTLLALLLLVAGCAARHVPMADAPPVTLITTADGATIALHHRSTPGGPPVVLCHGISSNHRFWDLAPGRSLARTLQAGGYDVWNLDLRGHGDAIQDANGHRQRQRWTIDDYGLHDLPAAFDHVRQETGAEDLAYVGHSLGGMVLAVYLSHVPDPPLSTAVIVASPLDFHHSDRVTRAALGMAPLAATIRRWPTPLGARWLATLGEHAPFRADAVLFSRKNLTPEARRLVLRTVVSPLTRGEIRQLSLARDGVFRSADGQTSYADALHGVTIPMLFVAGRADHIASPDHVRTFYDAVGSPDKAFVIASRANGMSGDYGHLDLGTGDHVNEDIFPVITAWLADHR